MKPGGVVFVGLALVAFAFACQDALADGGPSESAIEHGIALRREHRDEEALAEFRRAYAIAATPRALAQVALAEAAVAQWSNAEADLLRALGSDDPWIERQRGVLRIALTEIDGHLGTLEVVGPEGAELWIDGALTLRLPRPILRVPAKHIVVELRAVGFQAARRDIYLMPKTTVRIVFELEPAPPPLDPGPPPARTAVPAEVPRANRQGDRGAAWLAAGATGALLVAGVALTAYEFDRATHYNSDAECSDQPGLPRHVRCASYASEARAAQAAATTSYVLSGASALTSAVLFLLPARDPRNHAHLQCVPAFASAVCTWTFQ
jgi:hypothetical protein